MHSRIGGRRARAVVLAGWLAMGCAGAAFAQAPAVTAEDYARAEKLLSHNATPLVDHAIGSVHWIDDTQFRYRDHDANGDRFLRADAAHGVVVLAFDHVKLAKALATTTGKEVKAEKLPLTDWTRGDDGRLDVTANGKHYLCDLADKGACEAKPEAKEPVVPSPDKSREAFIRDWNLWVRDTATGEETRLTTDGVEDYGYATDNAGWTHSDRAILVWSPDSTRIATFRQDQRRTSEMVLVGTGVGAPEVERWKYPFVGDEHVTMIERVIIDVPASKVVRLKMPPDQHRSTCADDLVCSEGWEDVQWAPDGRTLAFVSTDRGHKSATLRVADAQTGAVREVYTETVATQYQSAPALASVNWRYLPQSNEFIWFSQKSDWGHLYLHDLATGKLKRQVTSGDWNVTRVAHLDADTRTLWFEGVGREPGNPYYVRYYKVGLDGGQVQLLTPENANHVITPSGDGRHFVDVYSTIDTAPVALLRDADGRQVAEIARADLTRLKASGWVPPSVFTVKARDGSTDLYGQMFKPSDFDPAKKYPIVVNIYPGPQQGSIDSRSFRPTYDDNQALAELGFIVIAVDGMGTPLRSKSFQDVSYANMADNTLPDQVAALEQLGAKHPWIDLDRVGIWGHSGGGNATADAMFTYPEVFKVGIAESGNHDNRSYEDDWGERYHGLLVKHEDGSSNYTGQDNASHAKNLEGKLLLIHGMMDDNVPPQSTLLVVDALVKANKDFDLLLLPHARHGYGSGEVGMYVTRRRWDYFVRHLLGAQPPAQYELKPAPKP